MQRAFVGLFAVSQITRFVGSIGGVAEGFNRIQRSAQIAAGPTGDVAAALQSVITTAQRAGADLSTTSQVFQRFALASRAAGLEQAQVATITDTLVRGFQIFTGSAAEANSAITQLSQAFSSGRLAGDEFRSVSENFPPLLRAISDVTGVATSDLRGFASQGNITSDVLIAAFARLRTEIAGLEASIEQNLSQIVNRLSNEFTLLVGRIDDAIGASELFRNVLNTLATNLQNTRIEAFGGDVDLLSERFAFLQGELERVTQEANEQNPVIAALFGAYSDLESVTERLGNVQGFLLQNFADVTRQIREADVEATSLSRAQDILAESVDGVNTVQQLQLNSILGAIPAYQALRAEIVALEVSLNGTDDQLERLSFAFGQFTDAQIDGSRETARLTANAIELATAYEDLGIFVDAASTSSQEFNDILTSSEIAIQNNIRVNAEFNASIENLIGSFSRFAGISTQSLENALANLATIGIDLEGTFGNLATSIAGALGVAESSVVNATSGIFSVLGGLGIQVEDIFGNRAAQAIQLLGSVSADEFQGILDVGSSVFNGAGDLINSVFGAGGTGQQALSSFGQSSLSTLTSATANINDLQAATGGLNVELLAGAAAAGTFAAGAAGLVTNLIGVNQQVQQASTLGAGLGAALGFGLGGPVGAAIGGVAGGTIFGFISSIAGGGGDGPDSAEAERLRQIGVRVGDAIRNGAQFTLAGVLEELVAIDITSVGANATLALFEDLAISVGAFNEALIGAGVSIETTLRNRGANFSEFRTFAVDALEALSSSSNTAADAVSDAFNLSLIDVLSVFNALPPGVADSFAAIEQNAQQIAEVIALQFGISVDDVLLALDRLSGRASAAFAAIDDAGDFFAASLSNRFQVSLGATTALVNSFPDNFITSFSSIATNADEIARRIAVSFGLSFDEARAIVLEFAADAGITLSGLETNAVTLGETLVSELTLSTDAIASLLLVVAQVGSEAFQNIRVNADGEFQLIDAAANTAFNNFAATAGATTGDVQILLGLLASNADISLTDILTSGVFAFEGLSEANRASTTRILEAFGATTEQIVILLDGVGSEAEAAFGQVEAAGATSAANLLSIYGFSGDEIIQILQDVENNGAISFGGLTAVGEAELRLLLTSFGVAGDQINEIIFRVGQGAESVFADIGLFADANAQITEDAFASALAFIIANFGDLANGAIGDLLSIQGAAAGVSSSITSSLGGAASTARQVFGSITAGANSAAAAVSRAANAARLARAAQGFADGGIITGPVALGGAGAGRAFQTGGILGGLTSIFGGGVTPTSQLGLAGEAGPEAILPLDRVGGRLGVVASIPDSLIRALQDGGGRGGTTVIRENRVFIIRDASREDVDRLENQILDVDASVESRAEGIFSEILAEVTS